VQLDTFVKQSRLSTYDKKAVKKKRFEKNASLLRGYKKSLKEEGFDASISRKRSRQRREQKDDEAAAVGNNAHDSKAAARDKVNNEDDVNNKSRKKYRRTDPLFRAKQQAELKKKERAEKFAAIEQGKAVREKKLKERKVKAKRMMGRTKKGQPFMDNEILNMLEKIRKSTTST